MTTYLPRSAWTLAPVGGSTLVAPLGFAVHWPGSSTKWAGRSRDYVARALDGIRRYHVGTNGWRDIAYQVAIDHDGRVWDLRGVGTKSAANGDDGPNSSWGAVLLLLGPGERIPAAMSRAVADFRREVWLVRHPRAKSVTTHGAVRPGGTECPGPIASAAVRSGVFLAEPPKPPPTTKGWLMALTDAEQDDLYRLTQENNRLLADLHKSLHERRTGDSVGALYRLLVGPNPNDARYNKLMAAVERLELKHGPGAP